MWLTDAEQNQLLDEEPGTTNKIAKGVVQALRMLGIATKEDVIKVARIAERIERRELRAKAAASASYQMDVTENSP